MQLDASAAQEAQHRADCLNLVANFLEANGYNKTHAVRCVRNYYQHFLLHSAFPDLVSSESFVLNFAGSSTSPCLEAGPGERQ